ncbi:hypothetical protein [Acuticoccus sp.]|uniref:hypothetical protein n=1 Tax=Acuticoccus sp. TaxID=1904378 RepID=UPI003B51B0DB
MSDAELTRDRDRIRAWAEARGGRPAVVSATAGDKRPGALLRFDFAGKSKGLDDTSWDEFFKVLDDNKLAVLLQENTKSGNTSRFAKFVDAQEHGVEVAPARPQRARKGAKAGSQATAEGSAASEPQPRGRKAARTAEPDHAAADERGRSTPSKGGATGSSERGRSGAGRRSSAAGSEAEPSGGGDRDPAQAVTTRDHGTIREWVEARGGRPTVAKGTRGKKAGGILRIDFREPDDKLAQVDWDEFFEVFDRSQAAFLHQDRTRGGKLSRFNRFVDAAANAPHVDGVAGKGRAPGKAASASGATTTRASGAGSGRRRASPVAAEEGASGTQRPANTSRKGASAKGRAEHVTSGTTSSKTSASSSAKGGSSAERTASAKDASSGKGGSSAERTASAKGASSAKGGSSEKDHASTKGSSAKGSSAKGSSAKAAKMAKRDRASGASGGVGTARRRRHAGAQQEAAAQASDQTQAKRSHNGRRHGSAQGKRAEAEEASARKEEAPGRRARSDAAAGTARRKAASSDDGSMTTTDHTRIREWVEARGGRPSHVTDTSQAGDLGVLRIDFQAPDDGLASVDWRAFLEAFEEKKLAFLFKEKTKSGKVSRFCKFIDRDRG